MSRDITKYVPLILRKEKRHGTSRKRKALLSRLSNDEKCKDDPRVYRKILSLRHIVIAREHNKKQIRIEKDKHN